MHAPSPALVPAPDAFGAVRAWFAAEGWSPFPFQQAVWDAYARGE